MDLDKNWKQPKCPSANEWIKKLWYIYTMEFYAAERKEEFIPFATAWMELESIMLSEISQAVKNKYHMISPISGLLFLTLSTWKTHVLYSKRRIHQTLFPLFPPTNFCNLPPSC